MAGSSPIIGDRHGSSGSASPVAATKAASTDPWPTQTDEDIDRLVALHKVLIFLRPTFFKRLVSRKCRENLRASATEETSNVQL